MSVGTDSYRLLVSPTEKVISIAFEQKSVDEIVPGKGDTRGRGCVPVVERMGVFYRQVVLPGWKVPEVSANPIRAPGGGGRFLVLSIFKSSNQYNHNIITTRILWDLMTY